MGTIDWLIVLAYLVATMALGVYLSRKASGSLADFFVSGRSLPWWLAGTSMAATTFSIDTPLYIAGVVGKRGIAGNWEWWSFGIAHLVMIYIFARMWRRSEAITDAELTEIRYGGRMAAVLRGTKAFLFALPLNCIGIGYAMLAMVKVIDALNLWQSLGWSPGDSQKIWSVVGVSIFVLIYSGFSGLWGVVTTDFFQFFLGLFGAILVAIFAVSSVGGIQTLVESVQAQTQQDVLAFMPLTFHTDGGAWVQWSEAAGITASTLFAYVFVQWWAFRRSDGGGEFVQRLLAAKDEAEAEKSAWFFNALHYVVRTWPWILVALAAIVIFPNLEDPEIGYPRLMLEFLPPAVLGLVVASLIAAFMSTVSTSINWGASYLTNDLYRRFMHPEASQVELVLAGRVASVLVTVLGAIAAFYFDSISTVFRLVIAIGTGPGLVLILRWFWWRINAAAELSAMVTGFIVGSITSLPEAETLANVPGLSLPLFAPALNGLAVLQTRIFSDFGWRVITISLVTAVVWIAVMILTPPESDETLDRFYQRVRPGGPGWARQRERTGVASAQNLAWELQRVVAATFLMFGAMFALGGFLLLQSLTGWLSLIAAVGGGLWLRQLNKQANLRAAEIAAPVDD